MESVSGILEEFREEAAWSGYRGLAVLRTGSFVRGAEAAAKACRGDCLLIGTSSARRGLCRVEAGPLDLEEILGSEHSHVVVAVEGLLRPSLLAGAAETLRGGGVLWLVAGPRGSWNPGPPGGRGLYARYLEDMLGRMRPLLEVDLDSGRVLRHRPPAGRAVAWRGLGGFKSRKGVPRSLIGLCATRDQAEALETAAGFLRGRARSLLVRGDRGRGKSFLLGLTAALAVYWHLAGRIVVTGPSPLSVQSLMRGLMRGLEAVGLLAHRGVRVVSRGNVVLRVKGPWFRVSYESPDSLEPASLTYVDEAAATGIARIRRMARRGGKLALATTVHGYEGSGRAFEKLLIPELPRPLREAVLETPIRYPPGDPLEKWIYDAFLLKAEAPEPPPGELNPSYTSLDPARLAEDHGLLEKVVGILVQAHYRNTPDDLLAMLDAPHHELHALMQDDVPLAVAETGSEEPGESEASTLALRRLALYAPEALELRSLRVIRIAVTPSLQRRGLGTMLLGKIEEEAGRKGYDLVTTLFSRHDVLGFWLTNSYTPYYVSPRYNRVTGEKNLALAKPLTPRGRQALLGAASAFKLRLLVSSHSIYRDLAAEKIQLLLRSLPEARWGTGLTEEQYVRLRRFLEGQLGYEQAHDAVYLAVLGCLAGMPGLPLGEMEATLLAARVLQGKTLDEAARIAGLSQEEAEDTLGRVLRGLLRDCLQAPRAVGRD